jgi:nitroimidazol reductase NimA-like FMN-containing flavoprotein (pyridoxamine 5'-phosphate oxidase superfamily)
MAALNARIKRFILGIVASQTDLTLATIRADGYPQANTVSYASHGLSIYFGTARESQKVKNLQHCNKVSLTIDAPYADWSEIKGLSMGGVAEVLSDDAAESRRAMQLLTKRYPGLLDLPSPGDPAAMAFVKITPQVISVLDYAKGFGHTELVPVEAADLRR